MTLSIISRLRCRATALCLTVRILAISCLPITQPLACTAAEADPIAQLNAYLADNHTPRKPIAKTPFANMPLTREQADQAAALLWADHAATIKRERTKEMANRRITHGDHVMRFAYHRFGEAPAGKRSMYISMHGGGGGPARMNDQQWENQKRLYRLEEGVYVVPRAPTNTWNLWHQGHIDPMFDRLIQNMVVFEGVDPNRVYLMGYSAGGDGVYQLAPRMADRFAAAAMMAGHPNETWPLGLRNLPFTIHVGELDGGFKRNAVAKQWKQALAKLRAEDAGGYIHFAKLHQGKGHWMDRQDAEALPWMAKHTRNITPDRIVWKQDDVTHRRFYWLAIEKEQPKARSLIVANRNNQKINVRSGDLEKVTIRFNDNVVDMDKPITITNADTTVYTGKVTRTIAVIAKTLAERGDPTAVFSAEVTVKIDTTK